MATPHPLPEATRSVLIVVDMQNGFVADGGSCGRAGLPIERLKSAIAPCVRAVSIARAAGVPVIFTRYVFREDFADGGFLVHEKVPVLAAEKALVRGTWDADLLPDFPVQPNDYVLDKNRPSSFYATPLETWLHGLNVRDFVVCGVTTNVCVETTVRDASQRDYRTFVLEDAVAEYDEERHRASLKAMAFAFAHPMTVHTLEQAWRA